MQIKQWFGWQNSLAADLEVFSSNCTPFLPRDSQGGRKGIHYNTSANSVHSCGTSEAVRQREVPKEQQQILFFLNDAGGAPDLTLFQMCGSDHKI